MSRSTDACEREIAEVGEQYGIEKLRVKTGKKFVELPTSYLLKKLIEEVGELVEALTERNHISSNAHIDEEFGDVMITLTVLARQYDRSPTRCALKKIAELQGRLKKLKKKEN
jgi:NTP pyrophosphatase (non-canonical NTP hydrolase)